MGFDLRHQSISQDWPRYHLPYCLVRLEGGAWLPLNRNYKPLGMMSRDWVDYENYRAQAITFARDPRTFRNIWCGSQGEGKLWLYDDDPSSRVDYYERLGRLLSHKHRVRGVLARQEETPDGTEDVQ